MTLRWLELADERRWGTTLMLPRPISPDLAIAPNRQLVIEFDQRGTCVTPVATSTH
jgi:hypothetical protein